MAYSMQMWDAKWTKTHWKSIKARKNKKMGWEGEEDGEWEWEWKSKSDACLFVHLTCHLHWARAIQKNRLGQLHCRWKHRQDNSVHGIHEPVCVCVCVCLCVCVCPPKRRQKHHQPSLKKSFGKNLFPLICNEWRNKERELRGSLAPGGHLFISPS